MKKLLFILTLLPLLTFAQGNLSIVTLKNGTELKGIIKSIDPTEAVIMEIAGIETNLKIDTILKIEAIESQEPGSDANQQVVLQEVVAEDPLKEFKGFLLSKGNNVYVYYSNTDGNDNAKYDKEGAMVIRAKLKQDGFWKVVDNMNQAHFTLNYCVNTHGHDSADLSLSSWRTNKSILLAMKRTDESILRNNIVAQDFYDGAIKSLQKKIENGKLSKKIIEDFTIK